jgi:hypothetical protein
LIQKPHQLLRKYFPKRVSYQASPTYNLGEFPGVITKVIHLEVISIGEPGIKERVKSAQETNAFFKTVKSYLEQEPIGMKYEGYQLLNDNMLTYKGRLYIPNCDELKRFIMDELHKRPYNGHLGYQNMITTTKKLFYWPRLKKDIVDYLAKCLEC